MNITSANATILLSVPLVFPVPQQLQKFAADDIFGTDPIQVGENIMGVDGHLTSGFVNSPTNQRYALMADSESNFFFDQIALLERQNRTKYAINGVVLLPAVKTKFTMTRGFLSLWQPIPDAKKVLQSRTHTITWESAVPTPA
jgi:hypothetical protein